MSTSRVEENGYMEMISGEGKEEVTHLNGSGGIGVL